LVNFLIITEKLSNYTKKDIDKGQTPQDVYDICSCVRETFCLSYAIRKSNNLFIYLEDQYILFKLEGKNLRYLGPDERSQALLLNRVIIKSKSNAEHNRWIKSTPGILFMKFDNHTGIIEFIHEFKSLLLFYTDEESNQSYRIETLTDKNYLYIIPKSKKIPKTIKAIINSYENSINYVKHSKIKSLENIILYINFLIERNKK
jgi:tRNA pseudouridine-54 N-methylase